MSSVSREITAITTSHRALAKERERLLGVCERLDGERRRFEEECRRLGDAWSRSEEGKRQAEEDMRGLMDQLRKSEEDKGRLERELEVMRAVITRSPMDLSSISPEVWAAARAAVAREVPQNLTKCESRLFEVSLLFVGLRKDESVIWVIGCAPYIL